MRSFEPDVGCAFWELKLQHGEETSGVRCLWTRLEQGPFHCDHHKPIQVMEKEEKEAEGSYSTQFSL